MILLIKPIFIPQARPVDKNNSGAIPSRGNEAPIKNSQVTVDTFTASDNPALENVSQNDDPKTKTRSFYSQINFKDVTLEPEEALLYAKLQEKIKEKKKEYEDFVNKEGTSEEKLDLQRALSRIDHLTDIPEKCNALRTIPALFSFHVKEISEHLFSRSPRDLNFTLATVPFDSDRFNSLIWSYGENETKDISELINKVSNYLPDWDITPDAVYLPGLPIVVSAITKLQTEDQESLGEKFVVKKDGFAQKDIETINKAARLLKNSNWLNDNPTSLTRTECIRVLEDAPVDGRSAMAGRPYIVLNNDMDAVAFAETLIHEDKHYECSDLTNPLFELYNEQIEVENKIDPKAHPWTQSKKEKVNAARLLDELNAYSGSASFYLHILNSDELSSDEKKESLKTLLEIGTEAKQAIKLLKDNPDSLNEAGNKWLSMLEKTWGEINPKIDELRE